MQTLPRIIAVDLDGTLLSADHASISAYTGRILKRCAEKGAFVVPCTGRSNCIIPRNLFPFPYAVSSNGAIVSNFETNEILYADYIPAKHLEEAIAAIKKYPVLCELFEDLDMVVEKSFLEEIKRNPAKVPSFHLPYLLSGAVKTVDSFEEYMKQEPSRIVKINLPKESVRDCPQVAADIRDLRLFNIVTDGLHVEAMNANSSKGNGLLFLANYLGVAANEVIAFGDDENDISMISAAGWGVAMGNAIEEVKQHAGYQTQSNERDGVASFLEEHFEL